MSKPKSNKGLLSWLFSPAANKPNKEKVDLEYLINKYYSPRTRKKVIKRVINRNNRFH